MPHVRQNTALTKAYEMKIFPLDRGIEIDRIEDPKFIVRNSGRLVTV